MPAVVRSARPRPTPVLHPRRSARLTKAPIIQHDGDHKSLSRDMSHRSQFRLEFEAIYAEL